jgi:hypothetical protein
MLPCALKKVCIFACLNMIFVFIFSYSKLNVKNIMVFFSLNVTLSLMHIYPIVLWGFTQNSTYFFTRTAQCYIPKCACMFIALNAVPHMN